MTVEAGQSEDQWKSKYYDQLDRLEKKEKQWSNLELVLKKAVGRLSLAAEGQASSIDRYLREIRVAIKGDVDHFKLETILEDLSQRLAQIEEPNQRIIAALRTVLEPLTLPASCEKSRQNVLKQLAKATDDDKDSCVTEIQKLLKESIPVVAEKIEKKPGMLGRMLGKSDFSIQLEDKASATDEVEEASSNTIQQVTEIVSELDSQTPSDVRELLLRLLEQLVVPTDFHRNIEDMKVRIDESSEPSEWALLKEAALLINSIPVHMQKEKREFESFLHQITSRLKEMDSFLKNESDSIETAEKEGMLFDDNVVLHVDGIRDDVMQAGNLDDLKIVVEAKLENISQHIKDYRSTEKKRFSRVKKDVLDMQNQMMELEKESEVLKTIIVEKNKLAMFDALTGIPNRLAYEKKAEEEIARWKRFNNPLCLIVWDIDFFKKVNDSYGHKAGDKVLKTIAQLMNDRVRETDFLARFGGEEFVMLLPGTSEEESLRLANDLRSKVETCGFHYQGQAVSITVSCGISSFTGDDTLEKVFERADQSLYKAKENGRNQCIIAAS